MGLVVSLVWAVVSTCSAILRIRFESTWSLRTSWELHLGRFTVRVVIAAMELVSFMTWLMSLNVAVANVRTTVVLTLVAVVVTLVVAGGLDCRRCLATWI